jgi:hypothetical protein
MEMPKPTAHHAKLSQLAGEWRGEEILYPSPWTPEQRAAVGHFQARIGVDGMFLVTDYEEEREGTVFFRGHGVYGYDQARDEYTMYWFDSMGMSPAETLGKWEGATLTFANSHARGHSRYVYEVTSPDSFTFRILSSTDGAEWTSLMEGVYHRVR